MFVKDLGRGEDFPSVIDRRNLQDFMCFVFYPDNLWGVIHNREKERERAVRTRREIIGTTDFDTQLNTDTLQLAET